jgi:predicted RecA/RadA family phage recombinase
MKNYVQSGESLTLTAGGTLTSGQGLLVGTVFGVVAEGVVSGQLYTLVLEGVFDLPKAASVTPAVGAKVYWDNTNGNVTTTSSGNSLIGVAVVRYDKSIEPGFDPTDNGTAFRQVRFEIRFTDLDTAPARGDTIGDGATTWTVANVETKPEVGSWMIAVEDLSG